MHPVVQTSETAPQADQESAVSSVSARLAPAPARPAGLDGWLLCKALQSAGNIPLRIVLWDGAEAGVPQDRARFTLRVHDRKTLWGLLANPDLGFGDGYSAGRIELEGDLVSFLETMYRANGKQRGLPWLLGSLARMRVNTLTRARDNIYRHYDIGNEFYKLWLDGQMVYTCAYFLTPDTSLEAAQVAKMDHVCRKVRLRPGQLVYEAGCGWGSLARHMARHYGVRVRAFNISHQQIAYARERARAEGLAGQIEYVEDDYRNMSGTCDAFVSVGMLEHVGVKQYRALGEVVRRCLAPTGLGLIHSLGRNAPEVMNPWLEKRIFPGSFIPSLSEMAEVFEPFDFSVLDVENLRLHYAKTVEHWMRNFEGVADRASTMFDENFVRAWRLYLASSLAGFTSGCIQLFQVVFAQGTSNEVPWTREHLYPRD